MIKKTVDDAVLDAVLAKAFEEAAERDLAEMETDLEAARRYPEAYKKIERKRYNQTNRVGKSYRNGSSFAPVMKRIVSFVLIIGFVGCCLMLSAPKIRAEFAGLVTRFFEKCFSITLPTNVTTYETENFVFGYIPETYSVTKAKSTSVVSAYSFASSQTDCYFRIHIQAGTSAISQLDVKYTDMTEIQINGYTGYVIDSDDYSNIEVLWTDNINVYSVSGNLSEKDLIKISENIFEK